MRSRSAFALAGLLCLCVAVSPLGGCDPPIRPLDASSRDAGRLDAGEATPDARPDACGATLWCRDGDGDGYPRPDLCFPGCEPPSETGFVQVIEYDRDAGPAGSAWDCDDSRFEVRPEPTRAEICDGLDNDCNGLRDDDLDVPCGPGGECINGACRAP